MKVWPILLLSLIFPSLAVSETTPQNRAEICQIGAIGSPITSILEHPLRTVISVTYDSQDRLVNIEMDQYFQGSALVAIDGEIIFEKSFGYADSVSKILNKPFSKFEIGSITKQFTAAAILLLEERNLLKLSDPISKYIGQVPRDRWWQKMTIEDLLSHKSGNLKYYGSSLYPFEGQINLSDYVSLITQVPLLEEPGTTAKYSNLGYVLLKSIIETTSGRSYDRFLNEEFFEKLNMESTGVFRTGVNVQGMSMPHTLPILSQKPRFERSQVADKSYMQGAGDMYSDIYDLLKWHDALFRERIVLSDDSLKKMSNVTSRINDEDYGLGLFIRNRNSETIVGHSGSTLGSKSIVESSMNGRVTLVLLANADVSDISSGWIDRIWNLIFENCGLP